MEAMIKTILFDIDNTLLDFKKCAEDSIINAFKDWDLEYRPEYFSVFMAVNNYYWRLLEDGQISRDELYTKRWTEVFRRLGIKVDGVAFEKDFVKHLYNSHSLIEGAPEILEYLSKKYDLYIASNSSYNEQSSRLKASGLRDFFNEIYTSEELGAAKPSKEFFDTVFKDLGDPDKDSVLIIGDSPNADIKGGNDYGIKTCWFNFLEMPEDSIDADFKIKELSELKKLL